VVSPLPKALVQKLIALRLREIDQLSSETVRSALHISLPGRGTVISSAPLNQKRGDEALNPSGI